MSLGGKLLWLGLATIGGAVLVLAQASNRSYGPDRIWWDAGVSAILPWEEDYDNPDGIVGIVNKDGAVQAENHGFFQALGTNGRACITCHQPSNAMSVSSTAIRQRWAVTNGKDPIFAAVDGSNCPSLPQSDIRSHSLLIERGLFRIALPMPKNADFTIDAVHDPTGCNTNTRAGISVYRRPRVAANFGYITGDGIGAPKSFRLMTDGREASLLDQARTAITGHEEGKEPSREKLLEIVRFERQIFTAQMQDSRGGMLNEMGGPRLLGPNNLAEGKAPMPVAASLVSLAGFLDPPGPEIGTIQKDYRQSVARGSALFAKEACARCHNAGSAMKAMEIGTVNRKSKDEAGALPLFRVTCRSGSVIYTEDPGRAMTTGHCEDVGAIVMQQLRGLSARAPYFSNGSAKTIRDVIDFYDRRFAIGYTEGEKKDLENFLKAL